MSTWTNDEFHRIAEADELEIAPLGDDGTLRKPVPIWVVGVNNDLYVRSFRGADGAWWRAAHTSHQGHVRSGGVDKDVTFAEEADSDINDQIDAAFRTKYGHFGAAYIDPMIAARPTTLRLSPR
jgi:hypothetical protein